MEDKEIGVPMIDETDNLMAVSDPSELRRIFVEMGGNPSTKTFMAAEQRAADSAKRRYDSEFTENPYAHASQQTAKAFLNVAILFVRSIFQVGVPVAFVGLLLAEGAAAYVGFSAIMDPKVAAIYAMVIMLVSTVAMFLRESLLQNKADKEVVYKPTLKLLTNRVMYFFGRRELVQETSGEALLMTERAMSLVVWSIVIFGILGRVKGSIESDSLAGVPWLQAIQQIVEKSDLPTIMEYVGSILIPIAMYVCLHVLVYFIYRSYLLSTGGIDITSDKAFDFLSPPSYEAILQAELITVYRDMIYLLQAKNKKSLPISTTIDLQQPSPEQLPEPSAQ